MQCAFSLPLPLPFRLSLPARPLPPPPCTPRLFEPRSTSRAVLFSPARLRAPQRLYGRWSLPSALLSQGWPKAWSMYPVSSSLYPQDLQKRWQRGNKLLSKPGLPLESRKDDDSLVQSPARPMPGWGKKIQVLVAQCLAPTWPYLNFILPVKAPSEMAESIKKPL